MGKAKLQPKIDVKRGGFTLSEMLLVVALIAVISGLGGGLYAGTYKRMLVEKAARDFLLTAKYARIMAIERQQPYELQLDPNNTGFMLTTSQLNVESSTTEKVVVSDYYCRPVEFQGDVKFEDVRIGLGDSQAAGEGVTGEEEQIIVFQPNGSTDSAVIQIGDGKTHYSISILASTGKATMYVGKADEVKTGIVDLDAERL